MNKEIDTIKDFIVDFISSETTNANLNTNDLKNNVNLIEMKILDSIKFLELLTSIEDEYQLDLDFSELDPSEFTTIDGLVYHSKRCSA